MSHSIELERIVNGPIVNLSINDEGGFIIALTMTVKLKGKFALFKLSSNPKFT